MKKVTGIGGIFFKVKDPDASKKWYEKHLGIEMSEWGSQFVWREDENPDQRCVTAWSNFPEDTEYLNPSTAPFMINYRVQNLDQLLNELENAGIKQVGEMQEFEYGKFAWIMDPNGIKIELWEPIDAPFLK